MCDVSLQFKILCRRTDKNTWSSCRNIDTITDGYTDGIVPIGISPRVEKKLCYFAIITDGHTDGFYPSVFHRELKKNYIFLPQLPMGIPTGIPTDLP
jgi:hypothetical protein